MTTQTEAWYDSFWENIPDQVAEHDDGGRVAVRLLGELFRASVLRRVGDQIVGYQNIEFTPAAADLCFLRLIEETVAGVELLVEDS